MLTLLLVSMLFVASLDCIEEEIKVFEVPLMQANANAQRKELRANGKDVNIRCADAMC